MQYNEFIKLINIYLNECKFTSKGVEISRPFGGISAAVLGRSENFRIQTS